jgi:hypothetical protein
MSSLSTADVLRVLGLEQPGLFCAWWVGDPPTLAEELAAGRMAATASEIAEKLVSMHVELSRDLHQRLRSFSTTSDMDIEAERPEKALHLVSAAQMAIGDARARVPAGGARDKKVPPSTSQPWSPRWSAWSPTRRRPGAHACRHGGS